MVYIIDSNVLMDYPQIVEDKENKLVIPTSVLQELDGLKKHINPEVSTKARRAAVYISKNMDNLNWYNCDNFDKILVDDQIVNIAKEMNGTVITNDVYLKIKCTVKQIKTKGYSPKDDYDGIAHWYIDSVNDEKTQKDLNELLENGTLPPAISMCENQYLIIEDIAAESVIGTYVYRDGRLWETQGKRIKNRWIDCIYPKNEEQECLFDALNHKGNTIVYAGGKYGTGY